MRRYGDAPENQMQLELPGINDIGRERWEAARAWKNLNFNEWCFYKRNALEECQRSKDGKASPNVCLSDMRRRFRVEVPNAYAPAFARMAMAEDSRLDFRVAKSMFDPCAEVRL